MRDILFHENASFKSEEQKKSAKADKKVKQFFENKEESDRIKKGEKYFDDVFARIFEERIVPIIFESKSLVEVSQAIERISPKKGGAFGMGGFGKGNFLKNLKETSQREPLDTSSEEDLLWLFSPFHVQKVFF